MSVGNKRVILIFSIFRKKKDDPVLAYLVIQALYIIIKVLEIVILAFYIGAAQMAWGPSFYKEISKDWGSYGTSHDFINIILIVRAVIYAIVLGKSLTQGYLPIMKLNFDKLKIRYFFRGRDILVDCSAQLLPSAEREVLQTKA